VKETLHFLKNGILSNLTCLPDGHRELTGNEPFQALRGNHFFIARDSSGNAFGVRCEADLQASVLLQPLSIVATVFKIDPVLAPGS
jgi:hypothetical protein